MRKLKDHRYWKLEVNPFTENCMKVKNNIYDHFFEDFKRPSFVVETLVEHSLRKIVEI
jgi:hypothetical protein